MSELNFWAQKTYILIYIIIFYCEDSTWIRVASNSLQQPLVDQILISISESNFWAKKTYILIYIIIFYYEDSTWIRVASNSLQQPPVDQILISISELNFWPQKTYILICINIFCLYTWILASSSGLQVNGGRGIFFQNCV